MPSPLPPITGINTIDDVIAASEIAPGSQIHALKGDFFKVNAVLASQVKGVLDQIEELSPVLADLYKVLMQHEIDLINAGLVILRDSAWRFASLLAVEPSIMHSATIMVKDLEVAKLGTLILYPPGLLTAVVAVIASKESRDVVHNIEVLDGIASSPAPIKLTM